MSTEGNTNNTEEKLVQLNAMLEQLKNNYQSDRNKAYVYAMEIIDFAKKNLPEEEVVNPIFYGLIMAIRTQKTDHSDELLNNLIVLNRLYKKFHFFALYHKIALAYQQNQEFDQAIKYMKMAFEELDDSINETELAGAYLNFGVFYTSKGMLSTAIEKLNESLSLFKKIENNEGISKVLFSLGNLYYKKGQLEQALTSYSDAYRIKLKLDDQNAIAKVLNNIANIYMDMSDYQKALEFYQQALSIHEKQNDMHGIALKCNNIANVYTKLNDYQQAEKLYIKSLEIFKGLNLEKDISMVMGNMADLYYQHKEFPKAHQLYQETLSKKREIQDDYSLAIFLSKLARLSLETNDLQLSEQYLNESIAIAEKHDYQLIRCENEKIHSEIFKISGDCEKSLIKLESYLDLKQRMDDVNFSEKIAALKASFDTEQSEKEAEIYRLKTVELQKRNDIIEKQKKQLEESLDELKKSEISYEYLNNMIKFNIGNSIIGQSQEIKNILSLISRVATTDCTSILITGETGTGKELVARAIHDNSKRKRNNFCPVNVSAIPETLFESEFFGYRKNAFTGADTDKAGWFEIANNGTLFLDEIATLSLNLQSKLLRVLEDKKFIPIGATKEVSVDVRLVSASNIDFNQVINEDRFRSDLYHRLSAFIIHIPPLRERMDDLPLLLEFFVKKISLAMNKKINKIDKHVETALRNYSFPGNIRELRNMIERAVILSNSSTLKAEYFTIPDTEKITDKIIPLERLEKEMVIRALNTTSFHQANAAKLLDITAKSLERRMIKYGIRKDK